VGGVGLILPTVAACCLTAVTGIWRCVARRDCLQSAGFRAGLLNWNR